MSSSVQVQQESRLQAAVPVALEQEGQQKRNQQMLSDQQLRQQQLLMRQQLELEELLRRQSRSANIMSSSLSQISINSATDTTPARDEQESAAPMDRLSIGKL